MGQVLMKWNVNAKRQMFNCDCIRTIGIRSEIKSKYAVEISVGILFSQIIIDKQIAYAISIP